MSDRNTNFGAYLAGFVIGGLVGAAIALLLAPQSGEQTRTLIKEKSIELKEKAAETAEEARERAETTLIEARGRAEEAIQETRARAEELAQLTKERAAELRQRGQVVLEEQKARIESAIDSGKKATARSREEPASDTTEEAPAES